MGLGDRHVIVGDEKERGRKGKRVQAPRGPLRVQGDSCAGRSCGVALSVSVSAINSCDAGQTERRRPARARSLGGQLSVVEFRGRSGPPGGVRG